MKMHYPITSFLLMLSAGCSEIAEQKEKEAVRAATELQQLQELQCQAHVMQSAFIAASHSLQLVPMVPLVMADILCQQCREAESSSRVSTRKNNVEITKSDLGIEEEQDHPADN